MKQEDKSVVMGTKVTPWAAEAWNEICEALHTDTYHLLQQFIYAMIRGASLGHKVTPEIQRLLSALDFDAGWQNALNICAKDRLSIAQMILIVEQEGKRGFGAVMIDKPFMSEAEQTENADVIFERLCEVVFRRTYLKLRRLGTILNVSSQRELLERMLDEQIAVELEQQFQAELPGMGDRAENGKPYGYGKKTKAKQYRTPDSVALDGRFSFTDVPEYTMSNTEVPTYDVEYESEDAQHFDDPEEAWERIERDEEYDDNEED